MNRNEDFWQFVSNKLRKSEALILMFVVDASKSSPGRQGFKLALSQSGELQGTIGGGIMELNLLKEAKDMLSQGVVKPRLKPLVHQKTETDNPSGLICSGRQTVVLCPYSTKNLSALETAMLAHRKHGKLHIELSPEGLSFEQEPLTEHTPFWQEISDKQWVYRENVKADAHVYVVGGGHVGLALCRTLATLNLQISLFDHREALHTVEENTYANEIVIGPYSQLMQHIEEGPNSYVAVVTTSFVTDQEALSALCGRRFRYLGVMGSATKIAKIFSNLRQAGFSALADHEPRGLKARLKLADRLGARFAVLLGDDELAAGAWTVRDMAGSAQEKVPAAAVLDHLKERLGDG